MPELCTRGDDVRLLVEHFLRVKSERNGQPLREFTPEAMRALCDYPWPGNVRELENTIEYALAIGLDDELDTGGSAAGDYDCALRNRARTISGKCFRRT